MLDEAGFAAIAARPFGVISEGERQHVLLARALAIHPEDGELKARAASGSFPSRLRA